MSATSWKHRLLRLPQHLVYHLGNWYLERAWNAMMYAPETRGRVEHILETPDPNANCDAGALERSFPGAQVWRQSGWWRSMLLRYAFATHLAKNRVVLDTCSGLGWGGYIIAAVAKQVILLELDHEALTLGRQLWPSERINYVRGSALNIPLEDASVDLVLAMESIEHFTIEDIQRYLGELQRVLRPGGQLVGSSAFPETEAEAQAMCATNPYHLHVCTYREITALLTSRFRRSRVYPPNYFWARK